MKDKHVSRRRFAVIAGAISAGRIALGKTTTITAEKVIERVKTELGGDWPPAGPDGFKAGEPTTQVTGIATTAMATLEVLKKAAKDGANLVLTFEPTFFGRADGPRRTVTATPGRGGPIGLAPDDPVYQGKQEFIAKNHLVVFRLRDHWQARKQNEMLTGLAESLGWTKYRLKPDDPLYDIPAMSAEETVALIRSKLHLRGGLRAVGDRKARIRRVLLHPGEMTAATMWQRYTDADLIVAGEVREWENTFFAADLHTIGEKPGLVTIGRVASEDPGMRACASWLKTVVKEVPSHWISAGDPYWRAV
jgi:putative NIF3 family GTP cyclohydrolase 1 type 2